MATIKEFAEQRGIKPGKLVDEFRRKYPGQGWTIHSELPSEFVMAAQQIPTVDQTPLETASQQPQQAPAGGMGEAPITKADEAVQQASHKLVQADRVTLAQAAEVQVTQSSVLGAAAGIEAGLEFASSLIESRGTVLDAITQETLLQTDESLAAIDESMFKLAERSSACLGKSIQMQVQTQQRMQALKDRVAKLTNSIGS